MGCGYRVCDIPHLLRHITHPITTGDSKVEKYTVDTGPITHGTVGWRVVGPNIVIDCTSKDQADILALVLNQAGFVHMKPPPSK